MNRIAQSRRVIAIALLAAFATAAVAETASAGHRRGGWEKHRRVHRAPRVHRVTEVHHSDSFGPAFAGLIGGLALGAVLSNASDARACEQPVRAQYYYWDPYCRVRYASLDAYGRHIHRGCEHPRRVRVISVSTGECVRWLSYRHGEWNECGADRAWERDRGWKRSHGYEGHEYDHDGHDDDWDHEDD